MTATLTNPSDKLKDFKVNLQPMLGGIGVAPPSDQSIRAGDLGPFGGNMDYPGVAEGARLYLPVFTPGAYLFLGDAHAVQGDGELTGTGLETSMDVRVWTQLIQHLIAKSWIIERKFLAVFSNRVAKRRISFILQKNRSTIFLWA